MKKTLLSALTAAFVLSAISPQVSAAPIDEAQEPEMDFPTPVMSARQNHDAQIDNELSDLRARVALLERESDYRNSYDYDAKDDNDWTKKFSLKGEMRYRFWNDKPRPLKSDKTPDARSKNQLQLRLLPTININDNLAIKARFTATYNHMENDSDASWATNFAYLEGKFDKFQVNAGKMPLYTNVDKGMIADDFFSGVQFTTNVNGVNLTVNAGDWDERDDYIGAEATYDLKDDWTVGVGLHHFQNVGTNASKSNIFVAGSEFKLNDEWSVNGAYGHNNKGGNHKDAFNIEGDYLGAKRSEEGTWGAYVAYRYIPSTVGIVPTYDTFSNNTSKKGFDFGGSYTPMKDTLVNVSYFYGKHFNHKNARTFFARASIFF